MLSTFRLAIEKCASTAGGYYCCFHYSCNSSHVSKCLNFCASDYSLNSQYFFMIFVAMYLYNFSLDAGTKIIIKVSVFTKLEKWPSESVQGITPSVFIILISNKKENTLLFILQVPILFCSKKVIMMGRTDGAPPLLHLRKLSASIKNCLFNFCRISFK